MNNQAISEINRTSDGTIATCIRQAQMEHYLWFGLDSNSYDVIRCIRSKAAAFAMNQMKVKWLEVWHDFIKSELIYHATKISLCLADNAETLGVIPDDVTFKLENNIAQNEIEYKVPHKAYENFMRQGDYVLVNQGFDKYYGGL